MSLSSLASLGSLRIQAKQRADLEFSPNITDAEWNVLISNSYKELYDLLVSAYGNEYYLQTPYQLTVYSNQLYSLPTDFYKLLGVDLQYSASPTGWVTLKRFEFIERNKYNYLTPAINGPQILQIWYIPEPTSLAFMPTCSLTSSSTTVGISDTTDIVVGMKVYGNGIAGYGVATATPVTVTAVNTALSQITISSAATATLPIQTLTFWNDSTTLDGISGWEEYIIIDSALKAGVKQETDTTDLKEQKMAMKLRIESMAEGRDAGQAHHVSDALCVNSWGTQQLGSAGYRYRLMGSSIMLVPCFDGDDTSGMMGGGWGC